MLKQKIPFYYLFFAIFSGVAFSYFVFQTLQQNSDFFASEKNSVAASKMCDYNFTRLQGYKHIKPLVWVHPNCESDKFLAFKAQLVDVIQNYVQKGILNSASFDLRDLKQGDWISYNSEEKFSPGSLMKVPVMITILRMTEDNSRLLEREVVFDQPFHREMKPNFQDKTIVLGNRYTIKQLLQRMIQNSDNDAADLLCKNLDPVAFKKTFTDFGFPEGNLSKVYPITTVEFSAYMEMLYNAGYLTINDSEYATSLLASSSFKQGLVSGLPDSIVIAHKFGESGDSQVQQLHESGIIYYNDSPYLLTVMTKGPDIKKLPEVIGMISRVTYLSISNAETNKIAQNGATH